jgi:hypothetical protein
VCITASQHHRAFLGSVVIGSGEPSLGPAGLSGPTGIAVFGEEVVLVADTGNNRVLVWKTMPATDDTPADLVLGPPDFQSSSTPITPSASSMNAPRGIYFDGARLFVADTGNNRVLVWNGLPSASGQPADHVLGQSNFASGQPNGAAAAPTAATLSGPLAVTVIAGTHVVVSDAGNHRVLFFSGPVTNGMSASGVLGQPDFVHGDAPASPTASRLRAPSALATESGLLFVGDSGHNRVLRYQVRP